jgi:class 3 adenylate cyclase
MADSPCGTVTFLFTDIEGSTKLWEQHPEAMRLALARHDALLQEILRSQGGHVFRIGFQGLFADTPPGYRPLIGQSLEGLAKISRVDGSAKRSARLFAVADVLRTVMGDPLAPTERAAHDRSVAAVRTALGAERFTAAWAEGRAMAVEDAIKLALEQGSHTC